MIPTLKRPSPVAYLFLAGWIAAAIIYISHLGDIPVQATNDECRRALVPLEMSISDQYLSPTINGELYLNKPPLYSMLVLFVYETIGSHRALVFRLPMILSFLACGMVLFYMIRRYAGDTVAALTALAFLTNGRAMTYDTLLGLLEFSHALFILLAWFCIFHFGEKRKYIWLFATAYGCAALAFLLKGLPAIAHVGLAAMVYLSIAKQWHLLFRWEHLVGVLTFVLIIAGVTWPFVLHNDIALSAMSGKLVSESAKRYDLDSISHALYLLYDFPLDFLRHFAPWTLLALLLIQRNIKAILQSNRLIWFGTWVFIINIPIYWFASLKQPHYVYMLVAIFFMVVLFVWEKTRQEALVKKIIRIILGVALGCMAVLSFYLPYSGMIERIPNAGWLSAMFGVVMTTAGLLYWCFPSRQLFVFAFALLLVRLGFNVFVIPQRVEAQLAFYTLADKINSIVREQPLAIYGSYPAGFYDPVTYTLELTRKEIIPVTEAPVKEFLLMDEKKLDTAQFEILLSHPFIFADLNERHEGTIYLVKRKLTRALR